MKQNGPHRKTAHSLLVMGAFTVEKDKAALLRKAVKETAVKSLPLLREIRRLAGELHLLAVEKGPLAAKDALYKKKTRELSNLIRKLNHGISGTCPEKGVFNEENSQRFAGTIFRQVVVEVLSSLSATFWALGSYNSLDRWNPNYMAESGNLARIISEIESSGKDHGKSLLSDLLDRCPGTRLLVEARAK